MSRTRFVHRPGHPKASRFGMVSVDDLGDWRESEELAINAGICVDRYLEGQRTTDGTDIGSRRKLKDYCKRTGYTAASDYKPDWGQRVRSSQERAFDKGTRETVERTLYRMERTPKR